MKQIIPLLIFFIALISFVSAQKMNTTNYNMWFVNDVGMYSEVNTTTYKISATIGEQLVGEIDYTTYIAWYGLPYGLAKVVIVVPAVGFNVTSCDINSNPFLKYNIPLIAQKRDRIPFICFVNRNSSCVAYVTKDGDVLQRNPDVELIEDYGIQSTFDSVGNISGYVKLYITKKNLVPDLNFSLEVKCADNETIVNYSQDIIPTYKDLSITAYRGVWVKDNIGTFLGVLLVIIFLSITILKLRKNPII